VYGCRALQAWKRSIRSTTRARRTGWFRGGAAHALRLLALSYLYDIAVWVAYVAAALPGTWSIRAELLRRHGAHEAADAVAALADELLDALRVEQVAALTLAEAAQESGYTIDQLSKQLRAGHIPNAGRPRAPRIMRRDLPRKAGTVHLPSGSGSDMLSDARRRMARAVAHSQEGDER
jgi:hypothetical protein